MSALRKITFALLGIAAVAAITGAWALLDRAGYLPHWAGISSSRAASFVLEADPASLNEGLRSVILAALRDKRIAVLSAKVDSEGVELALPERNLQSAPAQISGVYTAEQVSVRKVDDRTIRISFTPAAMTERKRAMAASASRIIEARLSDLGGFRLSNLSGYRLSVVPRDDGAIAVRVSQTDEIGRLIDFATKPADLQFRIVNTRIQADQVRPGSLPEYDVIQPRSGKPVVVAKRAVVTGRDFAEVQPGTDARSNEPIVSFKFNTNGARAFAQATTENVGQPVAIVLDGEILSMPVIREPITGGQGQVSGGFTTQSARELAILLRYGPLPAKLGVIEQK